MSHLLLPNANTKKLQNCKYYTWVQKLLSKIKKKTEIKRTTFSHASQSYGLPEKPAIVMEFFAMGFLRKLGFIIGFFESSWKKLCHCFTYNTGGNSVVSMFVCLLSLFVFIYVSQMIYHNIEQSFWLTRHFRTLACYNKYWNGDFFIYSPGYQQVLASLHLVCRHFLKQFY